MTQIQSSELTVAIRNQARMLGLTKIGIAPAKELGEEKSHLEAWLASGYQASMAWMERNVEKRIDPRKILPGAESVIVAALNYYTDIPHGQDPSTGKISRYAWGEDYHRVLSEKLEALLESIEMLDSAAEGMVYVDTGPVMEKAWAQRAGIGWLGKHTNVITRDVGSWVFLGVILLNRQLEYDVPATDHCGTCTRCIEACPTSAFPAPYVLDSNRCISYLTIEHRGEFAIGQGFDFDHWIYGCDICQDVCPWNEKFSQPSPLTEFQPREGHRAPELQKLADMTEQEFREQFQHSPIRRTKRSGLQRNVAAVLSPSVHLH